MTRQLRAQASTDPLTGLLNRRAFDEGLQREWSLSARDRIPSHLVLADLDGFKEINDRHGHAAGDRALVAVANALRLVTRSTDIVGRLGGDEFAVLLVRSLEPDTAERFLVRLRSALHETTQDLDVAVEASAGHVVLTQTSSPSAAMEAADAAMYADKRGRRAGR